MTQATRYKNKDLTHTENKTLNQLAKYSESVASIGEDIKLTHSISQTMKEYFSGLEESITKREGYYKVQGRLNYLLAKRFIWTTFNNLRDIDLDVVTPRIKSISDDLQLMHMLYSDFERNIKNPTAAFENIFLSSQKEYTLLQKFNEKIKKKLSILKTKETSLAALKKAQEEELKKISKKNKELYQAKLKALKTVNGTYVDIVHMIAKLQEEFTKNYKKLDLFINSYRSDFLEKFQKESKKYKSAMIEILNAQAYLLDTTLWKEAKASKTILAYFRALPVGVELNTKGYLKYYLDSLDEEKSGENSKELFSLYEHLQKTQKDHIMVLMGSAQDAMELESALKNICSENMQVKAFIDETAAFKWAMSNHVRIIILEEHLATMDAKKFLDFYHSAIFSRPKIVLEGNQLSLSTKNYTIAKRLSNGSGTHKVVQTIKELCPDETH